MNLGLLSAVVILLVCMAAAAVITESRCRGNAKGCGKGPHDWSYFGATSGPEPYGRFWDRQCQACGKFD